MPEVFYGVALVATNRLSQAIGSFYTGLSKPIVSVKLVSSIEDGIVWLQSLPRT